MFGCLGLIGAFLLIRKLLFQGFGIKRKRYITSNEILWVVDEVNIINRTKWNRKVIVEGVKGEYSRIPLKVNKDQLIIYKYCQETLEAFSSIQVDSSLILGGAGCTVPYYLLHKYDKSKTTIVEISPESIEMSKDYFLKFFVNKDRVSFICGDAKNVITTINPASKFDFIFCDLFIGENVIDLVFDAEFMSKLSSLLRGKGVLIINLGKAPIDKMQKLFQNLTNYFDKAFIFYYQNSFFGVAFYDSGDIQVLQKLSGLFRPLIGTD